MYPSGCVLGRITRNQTLLQTHRKFLWILEAWVEEITGGNRGQAEKKKKGVERITTFVKLYSNGSLEFQRTNSILTLMPQAYTLHAVYSCFQCLEVLGYTRTILNQSLLQTSQWVLGGVLHHPWSLIHTKVRYWMPVTQKEQKLTSFLFPCWIKWQNAFLHPCLQAQCR